MPLTDEQAMEFIKRGRQQGMSDNVIRQMIESEGGVGIVHDDGRGDGGHGVAQAAGGGELHGHQPLVAVGFVLGRDLDDDG